MFGELLNRTYEVLIWIERWLMDPGTIMQLVALALAGSIAFVLDRALRPVAWRLVPIIPNLEKLLVYAKPLVLPLLWLILAAAAIAVFGQFGKARDILEPAARLLTVWLLIRAASLFIRNRELARLFAILAWIIAALKISGLLDPTVDLLDAVALTIGKTRISALMIFTALLTFGVMLWLAILVSRVVEQSINRFPTLTPSAQVLLGKFARWSIIIIAILVAVSSLGIDLTALAVIGGAIGVGLGFGLQKVVSNLLSGFILLLDRSIKPGDVIEVDGTYGWINKLAARYTSVIARDGREHLIPNEDMVTHTVINWTYSSTKVRRHIGINVSYKADLKRAMDLVLEAAIETPRVLADPDPKCLVRAFTTDVIELELRIWIADPHNGVNNVASDVLLKVWDKFKAQGIQFPHPQLDLHITSLEALDDPDVQQKLAAFMSILQAKSKS